MTFLPLHHLSHGRVSGPSRDSGTLLTAKGLAALPGEDGSLCSLRTVPYLQDTQDFSLSPLPAQTLLPPSHTPRGTLLNLENKSLDFSTPLSNARPFQKRRHELGLTVHEKEMERTQGCQTSDTSDKDSPTTVTSAPAPEKQQITQISGRPLCPPLRQQLPELPVQAAGPGEEPMPVQPLCKHTKVFSKFMLIRKIKPYLTH